MADLDGDGEPEIGVAGSSNYVVFDGDGTLLWHKPIQEGTYTSAVVFDFEGDGGADVVYADELNLWTFSGTDGRSGALLTAEGGAAPDLVIRLAEGCEVLCVAEKLVLWVYVGNEGASDLVGGAKIDIIARTDGVDTLIESKDVPGPIPPGQFLDASVFEVLAADIDELRVVGTAAAQECRLDNNEAKRTSPFCGPPPR